jgi:hypothetical protein
MYAYVYVICENTKIIKKKQKENTYIESKNQKVE